MIKDYSKGKDESVSLHIAIDWEKVYTITLNKEEILSELRLEDLSQSDLNKKRPKTDYISKWNKFNYVNKKGDGFAIRSFFPSRKIYIENKEIWILKVNGDIIVRSENYKEIKGNYDHFYNEWKESKKN